VIGYDRDLVPVFVKVLCGNERKAPSFSSPVAVFVKSLSYIWRIAPCFVPREISVYRGSHCSKQKNQQGAIKHPADFGNIC